MTKKPPTGSQPWMPVNTYTSEKDLISKPPHDFELRAAKENPDIARVYLQYIVEDLDQGKKLSPKAANYLTHCLRELLDGKYPERAFNLINKPGSPSQIKRDIDVGIEYFVRKNNNGEKGTEIIENFWEEYGISAETFYGIRHYHGEFCKEQATIRLEKGTVDSEMIVAYIEQYKNMRKKNS